MLVPARYNRLLFILIAVSITLLLITTIHHRTYRHSASYVTAPGGSQQLLDGSNHKYPEIHLDPNELQKAARKKLHRPPVKPGKCLPDIEFLRRDELGLSDNIIWQRRCIKPNRSKINNLDRALVKSLPGPLVTHKTNVDLKTCKHSSLAPCEELELDVSNPFPEQEYPHLIFGVASKYDRIKDSLPATAHWLANTGARLVGVVVDYKEEEEGEGDNKIKKGNYNLTALEEQYAQWNVTATFKKPDMTIYIPSPYSKQPSDDEKKGVPVEHHHFMLIRDLLEHSTDKTQWLGILDDDTFFPSLYEMNIELAKHDPTEPLWLGALSEDFAHIKTWGLMAFGGAGVFMSKPLGQSLEPLLEKCISDATVDTGDGILRDCVYKHTKTKLTVINNMYQHDMLGDASGFFESGIQPLTLHHWKSWYKEPVPQQAAITKLCGSCYLQRWRFGDDTLLSNGYSITQYADGLDSVDLRKYEGTWETPGPAAEKAQHSYQYSFGSLRPKLGKDKKKSFRLRQSIVTPVSGIVRQFYVHEGNLDKKEKDEVIELLWDPSPAPSSASQESS